MLHSGSLTQAKLEKIANSVVELSEPLPDYRLGWTPVQDQEMLRGTTMPGYVEDSGGAPDFIRFIYARQPLNASAGAPQIVTVRGVQARLWLGDPNKTGTTVTSSASGKTAEIPTEETRSTLIQTDPETGICFRIQGSKLSKETMLRMAKSVEPGRAGTGQAEDASKAPASNALVSVSGAPASASGSADGTVERVPSFSELFPGQEPPAG